MVVKPTAECFHLFMRPHDQGDGSASILFYAEQKDAVEDAESDDAPFAEDGVEELVLKYDKGALYYLTHDYTKLPDDTRVWVRLKKVAIKE